MEPGHELDSLPQTLAAQLGKVQSDTSNVARPQVSSSTAVITGDQSQLETTCFYVNPIGEVGSNERKHSDPMFDSIVERAREEFGLTVVRADAIDKL